MVLRFNFIEFAQSHCIMFMRIFIRLIVDYVPRPWYTIIIKKINAARRQGQKGDQKNDSKRAY